MSDAQRGSFPLRLDRVRHDVLSPAPSDAGSSDSENGDGASQCIFPIAPNTPLSAASCSSPCLTIFGTEIDSAKQCVRTVLVGCLACPNGCGGAPEGPCYRNLADGRIVRVASYAVDEHPNDWVLCTSTEDQQVASLPRCND